MEIITLKPDNSAALYQAARLLVEGFRENWPEAWPTLGAALTTVRESFEPDRLSRIAVDEAGTLLGWIGGIRQYNGHLWELHPLVVRADRRKQGIGRALVADLEAQVRQRGGLTLLVGTDDENGMTSLAGINLYPNPLQHLAKLRNLKGHPYEFYQKLGFSVVGVLPDANGPGKPDIFMAKAVGPE